MLPIVPVLPLLLIARWTITAVPITTPVARSAVILLAMAPIPVWLGHFLWRILGEAVGAARWFQRVTGPAWTSGWRAAWAILRGRGGKRR